ncbi:MAG: hypothetical protein JW837_13495, partial [Sedimentisphaerales bacterium]|nr:hypothetical protein [Sedimentisphaerales bacterium]
MEKNFIALITIALLAIICQNASAVLIVDTGLPTSSVGWAVMDMDKYDSYQALAAEFTISEPECSITDIEGYFYVTNAEGNISIAITGDGGDFP